LLASAIAMEKPMAKRLFSSAGLNVADDIICTMDAFLEGEPMSRPFVVKPLNEGSSVGVHLFKQGDNHASYETFNHALDKEIMVERYIPGQELAVGVIGKGEDAKPMTVTEIITERSFYDYDAKYSHGESHHIYPAEIDPSVFNECLEAALIAHRTLGCRGISRSDFRYDGETLYILEVNTQPGMTPTSLIPEQAQTLNMSFEDIIQWMVENAECEG